MLVENDEMTKIRKYITADIAASLGATHQFRYDLGYRHVIVGFLESRCRYKCFDANFIQCKTQLFRLIRWIDVYLASIAY